MGAGTTFLANNKVGIASASGVLVHQTSSGNVSGTIIDTNGWTGVVFLVSYDACATASCSLSVQGAYTSASCAAGTSCNLSGTNVTLTANQSGQMAAIEVHKPTYRYIRLFANKDISGSTISSVYILYGPTGFASNCVPIYNTRTDRLGVTDASGGVTTAEIHVSPAQGTA
jgi:hypothetical protein